MLIQWGLRFGYVANVVLENHKRPAFPRCLFLKAGPTYFFVGELVAFIENDINKIMCGQELERYVVRLCY